MEHSRNPVIHNLRVTHYRSCLSTRLTLQPDLSVLIGPNGSGKTNILTSVVMLRNLVNEHPWRRQAELPLADQCRLTTDFKFQDTTLKMQAKVWFNTDERNSDSIIDSQQRWRIVSGDGSPTQRSRRPVELPFWYVRDFHDRIARRYVTSNLRRALTPPHKRAGVSDELFERVSNLADTLSTMKYYSASQFTNPSRCPVSFEVEQDSTTVRGRMIDGHRRFLYDLYAAQKRKSYATFLSAIGPDGIGLVDSIDFKEVRTSAIDVTVASGGKVQQKSRERLLIVPQFIIGKNILSPNQLSEGTFKTISLLFYVITQDSQMLLIEEPEVCVHQGLLNSIMELIKAHSKRKQIVISTHSDFVLDRVEPRNVLMVNRTSEAGTKVRSLEGSMSARAVTALRNYLRDEGNLGEYWRHGGFD